MKVVKIISNENEIKVLLKEFTEEEIKRMLEELTLWFIENINLEYIGTKYKNEIIFWGNKKLIEKIRSVSSNDLFSMLEPSNESPVSGEDSQ